MTNKLSYEPHKVKRLHALGDNVIVKDMNFEHRVTQAGLIIPGDDGKNSGIRPRWAQVYAVGPDQNDVRPGQWVLIAHGRWTRGIDIEDREGPITVRKVDVNDILVVSDEPVNDYNMSDKVV